MSFFQRLWKSISIHCLALAHHGDDQIETMLMRLTRGSTGMARAGIPFSRPFDKWNDFSTVFGFEKGMILKNIAKSIVLDPRIDPSNEKGIYSRNRFRKEVVPFLKKENPHVHEHFQRFSEELQVMKLFFRN